MRIRRIEASSIAVGTVSIFIQHCFSHRGIECRLRSIAQLPISELHRTYARYAHWFAVFS